MVTQYWSRTGGTAAKFAYGEAGRKPGRRLIIMGISATILVVLVIAIVVLASSRKDDRSPPEPEPRIATSIKAACDAALYPETCRDTLGSAINNESTLVDPETIFELSVEIAVEALGKVSSYIDGLANQSQSPLEAAALRDCKNLTQLAITQLNHTLATEDITAPQAIEDLRTWLSSAMTFQDTCVEGFSNSPGTLQSLIDGALKNTTELSSNSLAILTSISKFLKSIKLNRRRLLSYGPSTDGYPYWAKAQVRKLMMWNADKYQLQADMVVSQDGLGDYTRITDAIMAVPEEREEVTMIYVRAGTYWENIWIDKKKWNVMLVGDGMDHTIISFNLSFADDVPTFSTATFGALGKGFIAKDIAFKNAAGPENHQAVAMLSASDKAVFYQVKFDGYQDTVYAHSNRQFYRECVILGTIDFVFGNAGAIFQNCEIVLRKPNLGSQDIVTAQGKSDPNMNTGFSFHNCKVVAGDGENLTSVPAYLGRPWRPYSTTVFMKTMLGDVINPAGWLPWNGLGTDHEVPDTIYYGEFENVGPGAATWRRVKWKGVHSEMTVGDASMLTVANLINGDNWLPMASVPYLSHL